MNRDLEYFRTRAAQEHQRADEAVDQCAAAIHRSLALKYEALVKAGAQAIGPAPGTKQVQ